MSETSRFTDEEFERIAFWDRVNDGNVRPCPSSAIAVLGVESPTRVRCGLLHGHDGPHIFRIEWTEAQP